MVDEPYHTQNAADDCIYSDSDRERRVSTDGQHVLLIVCHQLADQLIRMVSFTVQEKYPGSHAIHSKELNICPSEL